MFFYLHIPFCRQKCLYCKFALTPKFDELKVRIYIDALKREIAGFFIENQSDIPLSFQRRGARGEAIETIYFGGGTPSILTSEQISEILEMFHTSRPVSFKETGLRDTEITLESNPEDITSEYLDALSRL